MTAATRETNCRTRGAQLAPVRRFAAEINRMKNKSQVLMRRSPPPQQEPAGLKRRAQV
jgi:hypothetical protein